MAQALTGFGIFVVLVSLYSLGTWFGHSLAANQLIWDVKTTQEGFLEVSKFLGQWFLTFCYALPFLRFLVTNYQKSKKNFPKK